MAVTAISAGTGFRSWKLGRLYLELYSTWPSATPSEVWDVTAGPYELPYGSLGANKAAAVTVKTSPWRTVPGFATDPVFGLTRPTLTPYSRLVRVVAVGTDAGDVAIYTAVLGRVQPAGPHTWTVELVDPADLYLDEYTGTALSLPNSAAPYSGAATVFGTFSASADQTPVTTYRDAWKRAFETAQGADLGVGASLNWVAGSPASVPAGQTFTYALDHRATDLKSEGYEITPYITHSRTWAAGDVYTPPAQDRYVGGPLGLFVPRKTAQGQGSVVSSTVNSAPAWVAQSITFPPAGSGIGTTAGADFQEIVWTGLIPADTDFVKIVGAEMSLKVTVLTISGAVSLYVKTGTGSADATENTYAINQTGTYTFNFNVSDKTLGQAATFTATVGLKVSPRSAGSATMTFLNGNNAVIRKATTTYTLAVSQWPSGLGYPATTTEAFSFILPGLHIPPFAVSGLPGNVTQYAAGSTPQVGEDGTLKTLIRTSALPFKGVAPAARPRGM